MSARKNKFDFLTEERQQRDPEETTGAQASKRTHAQASIERKPSGQRIRSDLLRAIKIMAAETGTPQYVLIEEALEQYLASKRTS